jgi:hypothetical protein
MKTIETTKWYESVTACALSHQTFTVDQVIESYERSHGADYESRRAVGGALISAVFAGLIEDSGKWVDTSTGLTKRAGKPKRLWVSRVFQGPSDVLQGA